MSARPLANGPIDLLAITGDALAEVAWETGDTGGTDPTTATGFFAAFPWETREPAPDDDDLRSRPETLATPPPP